MNNNFYIYRHSRRAYEKAKYKHNNYWNRIVDKHNYEIEIIMDNLSEEEAFSKEIEFIKMYKDLGFCEANLTNGGEGTSGRVISQETRIKMSKAQIGKVASKQKRAKLSEINKGNKNHLGHVHSKEARKKISLANKGNPSPMKGKHHSEKTKLKISKAKIGTISPRRKQVIDLSTGFV